VEPLKNQTTRNGIHVNANRHTRMAYLFSALYLLSAASWASASPATSHAPHKHVAAVETPAAAPANLDRSGKPRQGEASYYGHRFYKKKMADGTPMNPQSNSAASKTLPLGTKAQVTNLQNGSSDVVEIRDRGPYVGDRIVDVSPKTADKLGLKQDGTAPVVVKPLEVPKADTSAPAK
jgi:rare lipoprotein A